jgi:hypothetical protein
MVLPRRLGGGLGGVGAVGEFGQDKPRPGRRQRQGGRLADAGAGAGDDRDLPSTRALGNCIAICSFARSASCRVAPPAQ